MRLGEEQIEFNLVNSMKYSPEVDSCWMVEEVDMLAIEAERKDFEEDPLKLYLNESIMDEEAANTEEIKEMVRALDDCNTRQQKSRPDFFYFIYYYIRVFLRV